jgi:hypothetical protein
MFRFRHRIRWRRNCAVCQSSPACIACLGPELKCGGEEEVVAIDANAGLRREVEKALCLGLLGLGVMLVGGSGETILEGQRTYGCSSVCELTV